MNEEKINQILRNQKVILEVELGYSADEETKEQLERTEELLSPIKEKTINDETQDAFSEEVAK